MHRIFVAINLPEEVKVELGNLEKEIADMFPEEASRGLIRWVKKENLHLTLLFIGLVKDEEIPQVSQIVRSIVQAQKSFSLKFEKVCYGPSNKIPPRLIWLDIEEEPGLLTLAEKLKEEMTQTGILRKIEKRRFSPHITLGRIRTWQWQRMDPEERPVIEREISLNFEVKSIEMMESVLKRTGSEYIILESTKLT